VRLEALVQLVWTSVAFGFVPRLDSKLNNAFEHASRDAAVTRASILAMESYYFVAETAEASFACLMD